MIHIKLSELMEVNNISINELSSKTGISRNSLTQLANNKSKMVQFSTLEKLTSFFEIDLFELIDEQPSGEIIIYFKQRPKHNLLPTEIIIKNQSDNMEFKMVCDLSLISFNEHGLNFYVLVIKAKSKNFSRGGETNIVTDFDKNINGIPSETIEDISRILLQEYFSNLGDLVLPFEKNELFQDPLTVFASSDDLPELSQSFQIRYDPQGSEYSVARIRQWDYESKIVHPVGSEYDPFPIRVVRKYNKK